MVPSFQLPASSAGRALTGAPALCIVSHQAYGAMTGGRSGAIGGVEWQTSLLAKWFAARGWRVSMLTWDEGGPPEEVIDGVRVIKICRRDAGLPGLRFFHPKWTGLVRAMRAADADVYYQNCGECVTGQMALWCRRSSRPFVFSAASDADCDPHLPELRTRRERVLYRYGLRQADRVIVQTLTQQRRMRECFGRDAVVIPMPCPGPGDGQFQLPSPQTERVLWIGRVRPVKRPDRFLDLAAACPELQFDLVGPLFQDDCCQMIQRRAVTLSNLTVHGPVPRDRLGAVYQRAAVLCCTSDYEGFPNTFLEAWSYGLPIVSTFDPDGLIASRQLGVVVKDVAEMAQAIRALLSSPDRYRQMSENARRYYLQNHTLEVVMPRFEALFREVAAQVRERRAES